MAIELYIGAEGSGKTYQVVTVSVREALKQGRRVLTNIPQINGDLIIEHIKQHDFKSPEEYENIEFGTIEYFRSHEIHDNPKFFPDLSDRNFVVMEDLGDLSQYTVQAGDLFVIDECFEVYHRERKFSLHDETFYRKHRKYVNEKTKLSTEIILMTQDKNACNKHLLATVTFTYEATKKEEIGQPNRYNIDIYKGIPLYRAKPIDTLVLQSYDKNKFPWYKSHAVEGARQLTVDKRKNVLGKKKLILMASFPIVFIITVIFALKSLTDDEAQITEIAETTKTTKTIEQPKTIETNYNLATDFYITGIVERGQQKIFYLSDGKTTKTIINPTKIERFGRTYNLEWNHKWYTNYSYSSFSSS